MAEDSEQEALELSYLVARHVIVDLEDGIVRPARLILGVVLSAGRPCRL
jgi:hypothetical protein